jgi:hypothetical protein
MTFSHVNNEKITIGKAASFIFTNVVLLYVYITHYCHQVAHFGA